MIGPSVQGVISVSKIGEKDGEVNGVNTVFLFWQSCRYMMRSYTLGETLGSHLEETTVACSSPVKSQSPRLEESEAPD